MSKKGTSFCKAEKIQARAEMIFGRLQREQLFRHMTFPQYVENIVDFNCDTNILHPFREGNGRVQRVFLTQLIRFVGYDIDFPFIDSDLLMIATIQAASGVTNQQAKIFEEHIES